MATILVVDDSSVSRHLLSYTLKREGHHVIALAEGCEALRLLNTATIDLVIADLNMPGMNGIALLKSMRASERTRYVQLLMLTSSGSDLDRQAAQEAGVSGFLTKPASSRDLLAAVNQGLQHYFTASSAI